MSVVNDRQRLGRIADIQTAMGQIYRYGVRLYREGVPSVLVEKDEFEEWGVKCEIDGEMPEQEMVVIREDEFIKCMKGLEDEFDEIVERITE